MSAAPFPANEAERLDELYSYNILDTLPEAHWEDLVTLAAQICQTPIAAISFVDQDRQWFKAIKGLDVRETHRDLAFCAHSILQDRVLVVPDASEDERFQDNALVVEEPHIRFYAGAQIYGDQGHALGSFCVIDRESRELSQAQLQALSALARQASLLLKLHKQQQTLQDAANEADKLASIRKQVLSNTSHEMRTPLNAIVGYTRLLSQTQLTKQQRNYIQKMQSSSQHILEMVNSILDLSKIEAGKMHIEREPFPLEPLLSNLRDVLSLLAEAKSLELIFDIDINFPRQLWGDSLRLEQVLLNLLSNAIKFTSKGVVTLKMRAEYQSTHCLCYFEVSDTGIGMDAEQRARVLEPFSQADTSVSRRFGGTGLGLSISQELVHLMGGDLQIQSAVGEGTSISFLLTMPLEASPPQKPSNKQIDDLKVLVVDDNSDMLSLMKIYLDHLGCQVTLEESPERAVQLFTAAQQKSEPFDLLLIDWRMPELSGLELFKQLKGHFLTHVPNVVFMTGHGHELTSEPALLEQISGVLHKPITQSTLYDCLLGALTPESQAEVQGKHSLPRFHGHILLVEDNEINRDIVCEYLGQMQLEVAIATNGQEAVERVESGPSYDLVLMDLHMPVMDGLEATAQIRQIKDKADLPIVALTADVFEEVQKDCYRLGMNDLLAKPLDVQKLIQVFEKYLDSSSTPQASAESPAIGDPDEADTLSSAAPLPDTTRPLAPASVLPELSNSALHSSSDFSLFAEQLKELSLKGLYDFEGAQARVAGNLDLLWRLLQRFLEKNRNFPAEIAELWEKDFTLLRRKLHTFKGTAGNLGLSLLQRAARLLEDLSPDDPRRPESLEAFEVAHDAVYAAFDAIQSAEEEAAGDSLDARGEDEERAPARPEQLHQALLELSVTLARFDVQAGQQIAALQQQSDRHQEALGEIAQAIEIFDYPRANALVLKLLEQLTS